MRRTEPRRPISDVEVTVSNPEGKVLGKWRTTAEGEHVSPEGPREHTVNALTSLSYFREAHGGDWYAVLNGPVKIGELAGLLEGVEARLRLATGL